MMPETEYNDRSPLITNSQASSSSSSSNSSSNSNSSTEQPPNSKIDTVKVQIEDVANIMKDNLNKTLKRGDQLADIQNKTEDLERDSAKFYRSSQTLRRQMFMKNIKLIALIVGIVLVLILIISLIIYSATK